MLRVEDAKPGVEVIAIKNHSDAVALSIGTIYTIREYCDDYLRAFTLAKETGGVVSLNEVRNIGIFVPAFRLDQFKLRDLGSLTNLFNLDNIDTDLLRENYFENC